MTPSHRTIKKYTALLCTAFLLSTLPYAVHADNDHRHRGHGHERESYDKNRGIYWSQPSRGNTTYVFITDRDRSTIRNYMHKHHKKHCPPGLAKKHHGCMPPGHHIRHYRVGEIVPQESILETLSRSLLGQLSPAPRGYRYVGVDNDVYLMNNNSRQISDAITWSLNENY